MRSFIKFICLMSIPVFFGSCSTFGTVSKGYSYSKQEIWASMSSIVEKNYGGIKRITPNPPTIISNLTVKDKKFGIDKTAYQAIIGLSGFNRPYVVDVEVRSYPSGEESGDYSVDRDKAQDIIDQIAVLLEHRKYNSSLQDEYQPY